MLKLVSSCFLLCSLTDLIRVLILLSTEVNPPWIKSIKKTAMKPSLAQRSSHTNTTFNLILIRTSVGEKPSASVWALDGFLLSFLWSHFSNVLWLKEMCVHIVQLYCLHIIQVFSGLSTVERHLFLCNWIIKLKDLHKHKTAWDM